MSMKKEILEVSEIFKALSDPTRLRLIRLLASNMEEKLCVVDLAVKLGVSQPATSQHLKVLKTVKILYSEKERPKIYYFLNLVEFRRQKKLVDKMYDFAFTRCSQGGLCEDCPFRDDCEDVSIE